jgi:hypothetical protein
LDALFLPPIVWQFDPVEKMEIIEVTRHGLLFGADDNDGHMV